MSASTVSRKPRAASQIHRYPERDARELRRGQQHCSNNQDSNVWTTAVWGMTPCCGRRARTTFTVTVALQAKVRPLAVNDQQPMYSGYKNAGLKCGCVLWVRISSTIFCCVPRRGGGRRCCQSGITQDFRSHLLLPSSGYKGVIFLRRQAKGPSERCSELVPVRVTTLFPSFSPVNRTRKFLNEGITKCLDTYCNINTGFTKKMDGIWNRDNLKSTGRIYTFCVLKCSEEFKVLDLP